MLDVSHYGLHWDGPTAWLVQGRGGSNFIGAKGICPFHVTSGACNHLIPAAAPIPDRVQWDYFLSFFDDPLVKAALPLPHRSGNNAFFVEDGDDKLTMGLATLSRMSSPIRGVVKSAWALKVKDLESQLQGSNLQPLIIVQANQKSQPLIDALTQMVAFSNRTVIVAGRREVVVSAPLKRITTKIGDLDHLDLTALPMENIGAALLRRYARREPLDSPMESREDRRNRLLIERTKDG